MRLPLIEALDLRPRPRPVLTPEALRMVAAFELVVDEFAQVQAELMSRARELSRTMPNDRAMIEAAREFMARY